MKKTMMILATVLIASVVSVFAFTACNIKLTSMDGTAYYSGTEKARSVELVDEFFAETLNDPDFVVTCKDKDGVVQYTETVKGTSSCTLYQDGSKTYAFKKGDNFYVAEITPSENGERETCTYRCSDSTKRGYYAGAQGETMEELYKSNYCRFMSKNDGAGIVKDLSEEDGTFRCMNKVETLSGFSSASLEFTYSAENSTVTLTAASEEDMVNSVRLTISETGEGGRNGDLTWTIVHGGASVTLPDTDAWDRENA